MVKPLITAGIFTAVGSAFGNRAIRGLAEGNPKLFNMLTCILGRGGIHARESETPKKLSELTSNINDVFAMEVGTVTPLLISGFLKTLKGDLNMSRFVTSIVVSGAVTTYFALRDERLQREAELRNKNGRIS